MLDFNYRSITPSDVAALRRDEHYSRINTQILAALDDDGSNIPSNGLASQIRAIVTAPAPAPYDFDYAYGAFRLCTNRADGAIADLWLGEMRKLGTASQMEKVSKDIIVCNHTYRNGVMTIWGSHIVYGDGAFQFVPNGDIPSRSDYRWAVRDQDDPFIAILEHRRKNNLPMVYNTHLAQMSRIIEPS